jgi:predicted nucleic acid-binding protein
MARAEAWILDTNVVLDWLVFAAPAFHPLQQAWDRGIWTWVATRPMLDELEAVLARPLPERWESARLKAIAMPASVQARVVDTPFPGPRFPRCSDASDQKFIDLALSHPVRCLLTHDRALLKLARPLLREGITVSTPAGWCAARAAAASRVA